MSTTVADIETWLAEAFSREHTGSYDDLKLGPVRRVLSHLPRPPAPVTVAGTKGKGSTVRLAEAMLLAHRRSVVAFTSPHVLDIHERWRIDGAMVDPATARRAAAQVAAAEAASGERLTYFERCFGIACVLAAAHGGDFLCEVGLGGRLDCANALDCRLAVLTHLSFDHVAILGNTLAAIAGEKLAIARPDAPLLIAPQSPAAAAAIAERLPVAAAIQWLEPLPADVAIGLAGDHQRGNAAVALAICQSLCPDADRERALAAIADCRLAARCQLVIHDGHRLLVDGAHNEPSLQATLATAEAVLGADFDLVLGCATDKDIDRFCRTIAGSRRILRCGYRGPRARGRDAWPAPAKAWPWYATIDAALAGLGPGRPCCITGSFYLAGEALAACGVRGIPG